METKEKQASHLATSAAANTTTPGANEREKNTHPTKTQKNTTYSTVSKVANTQLEKQIECLSLDCTLSEISPLQGGSPK
jgi:hypothetical protein